MTTKKVLLRVAYDIKPIAGKLPDLSRIQTTLPTIKKLLAQNATIFILTWVGRPQGVDKELSPKLHAQALSKLLNLPVSHLPDCIGPKIQAAIKNSQPGQIYMLENVRFHQEEGLTLKKAQLKIKRSDPIGKFNKFAKKLTEGYDALVFDAFPQAHRNTPSTVGIQKYLPTTLGLYTKIEIENLSPLLKDPKNLTLIIGGSKIKDKLSVIKNFITKADHILIAGAAANPLLAFQGVNIDKSLTEKITRPTWLNSKKVHLPIDYLTKNNQILDIGPQTIESWTRIISKSKTILWSGPLGKFEQDLFAAGTQKIAQAVAKSKAKSIIGGGDTITAINQLSNPKKFDFISLAGTAMLEFLSGKPLPALKTLCTPPECTR